MINHPTGEEVELLKYQIGYLEQLLEVEEQAVVEQSARLERTLCELQQEREALRKSEERTRSIIDSAIDAVITADVNGAIIGWNPAAEKILGWSRQEALGRTLASLIVPPQYRELHLSGLEAYRETGKGPVLNQRVELSAMHRNGRELPIELSICSAGSGKETIYSGFLRDITERRQAEQLARARDQAEIASRLKSEFLANMSHEIRTPMNGVIGMAGLLLDTELDDDQRRYAETVRSSGESLLGIISDILDFSKIEAGKLEMETLDFDLESLLDDFAATLAVRAQEKGLELLSAVDPACPTLLRGDPGRLRQILANLAGNALKFTPAGEVAVRVSLVEENENDVLLRFSVRDTGIGIPQDKIGLLFAKFSQVDASTTRQYGGTGLGLAISKQLAELMGGEAGVASEAGKGSEFWFTARLGKQPQGARAESRPPADLGGVRALIVDDNATSREILTTRMTSWGMRPSEADGGPGALQALCRALEENDPFRVAVIDMQMPGMNGEELAQAIKADQRLAGIRMMMLTSLGARGDAQRCQQIGVAAYATKPIRHQELFHVLSSVLSGIPDSGPRPIVTRHSARERSQPFAGRNARILLAEDNITNQQVALGILRKLGLRADAVANGAEAVQALASIPYDLVLMDVQMPVMDGIEATRQIRNPQSAVPNHGIPIIAMTAHAMQGDREHCLEAGMNGYVPKPVSPQALAKVLARWLPKKHGAVEGALPCAS